jgi:hypothetical protein
LKERDLARASHNVDRFGKPAATAGAVQAPEGNNLNLQGFSFRVAGTNRSLNQKVVFQGNVAAESVPSSALQMIDGSAIRGGLSSSQALPNDNSRQTGFNAILLNNAQGNSNTLFQRARIEGRASVGTKTEVSIEAQQVGATP